MKPIRSIFSIILLSALLAGLSLLKATPTRADTTIKVGDVVTGEFTDQVKEFRYTFTAKKLDYIELTGVVLGDAKNSLYVKLVLLDPAQQHVTDGGWGIVALNPKGVIPADGTYTIDLTPDPSSTSTSGKFKFQLQQAVPLIVGKPVKGTYQIDVDGLASDPIYLVNVNSTLRIRFSAPVVSGFGLQAGIVPLPADTSDNNANFCASSCAKIYLTLEGAYGGEVTTLLPMSTVPYVLDVGGYGGQSGSRDFSLNLETTQS